MARYLPVSRLIPTLRHVNQPSLRTHHRLHRQAVLTSYRYKSTKSSEEEVDLDQPLKFSTSRAATWQARDSYGSAPDENKMPWYQPMVVSVSVAVFLIYFCVLREENDVDNSLKKTLYDHIEGLEEKQLELALEHDTEAGKDTKMITSRLKEIREGKDGEVQSL